MHSYVTTSTNNTALCGLYNTAYAVLMIKQHNECIYTDAYTSYCGISIQAAYTAILQEQHEV